MHLSLSQDRSEYLWAEQKLVKSKAAVEHADSIDTPFNTHSSYTLNCLWSNKSTDLPDIEACNVVWDFHRRHSTQLVNTCQGVIRTQSTQNAPMFICGDNTIRNAATNTTQLSSKDSKASICLKKRRLSNASMEKHAHDRVLAEASVRASTFIYDCDDWIEHCSDYFEVIEVDLSHNRLSQIPSSIVSIAAKVEVLNLSHNRFTTFPEGLQHFKNLKVLNLSHNTISVGLPKELPSALTKLKVLRLFGNQITELPDNLGEMAQLETLQLGSILGGNSLQCFPENCLSKLINLRDLDLTHNQLVRLPADIGHSHSKLVRLAVSGNRLLSLPCSIGQCRLLRSFDLSRNSLLDLPIEITDLTGLETLDLTENNLCVIPGDIALFMSKTTVLLTGNPFTFGLRKPDLIFQDDQLNRRASLALQLGSPQSVHYGALSVSDEASSGDTTTVVSSNPTQAEVRLPTTGSLTVKPRQTFLVPSLRELAARQVLKHTITIPQYRLPANLLQYLENGARPCCHCQSPYVREWVGCIEIKNYLGHPQVPRSVRFCSSTCMIQTKKTNTIPDLNTENANDASTDITCKDPSSKPSIKPLLSVLISRTNQTPIKSRKPSSIWNTRRMADRPATTDW